MTQTDKELSGITASEYATQLNADALSNSQGCNFILMEEPDFWAKLGIHTGLDLARCNAMETYSDMYKEEHGFRPHKDFSNMTLAEINAAIDRI